MLSIVREGPRILVFETDYIEELKKFLEEGFAAKQHELNEAFESTEEGFSLILLTTKASQSDSCDIEDVILVTACDTGTILRAIINEKKSEMIKNVFSGPRIMIMRVFGNVEKVVGKISEEFGAKRLKVLDLLLEFKNKGNVVMFTTKPLNQKMCLSDLYGDGLLIDRDYLALSKKFRIEALKYLNEGLEKMDWYEMEIRIYDRYSAYDYHYEKLIKVLENLELGLVLGEAWTKDYPRMFMAVGVYRLRFFSFHDPEYIKKVLMGLEYSKDGIRIVDYDLYFKRKHIHWSEVIEDNIRARNELGMRFRAQIYSRLNGRLFREIADLDEKIMKTRVED